MTENDKTLTLFSTRVRQLILQYEQTKKENEELYVMLENQGSEIQRLKSILEQTKRDFESLKMAKMMEISDGDIDAAKKRISGLIKEVNKCITLLDIASSLEYEKSNHDTEPYDNILAQLTQEVEEALGVNQNPRLSKQ